MADKITITYHHVYDRDVKIPDIMHMMRIWVKFTFNLHVHIGTLDDTSSESDGDATFIKRLLSLSRSGNVRWPLKQFTCHRKY